VLENLEHQSSNLSLKTLIALYSNNMPENLPEDPK
jgi:hypothetical protein